MTVKYDPSICCVCGHPLKYHVDENEGWRCHAIAQDGYQCECWLRKHQFTENRDYYNLEKRVQQQIKELREI